MLYDGNSSLFTDRPLGNAISLGPANGIWGRKEIRGARPSVAAPFSQRSITTSQFHEQPQYLYVEPDQGYHEAESGVPFHVLRRAVSCTVINKIKIQDEVQRCNDDHKHAESYSK